MLITPAGDRFAVTEADGNVVAYGHFETATTAAQLRARTGPHVRQTIAADFVIDEIVAPIITQGSSDA